MDAEPVTRRHFQKRMLEFDGWLRSDGLWEFEARLTDRKPFPSWGMAGIERRAMEPYHHMWVRLVTDRKLTVTEIETKVLAHPYPDCQAAQANFQSLVGLRLARGWRKAVMERVGGVLGCNHMMELILPLPSMVIQATGYGTKFPEMGLADIRSAMIDSKLGPVGSCHAWRKNGPVAHEFAPHSIEAEG
jgi:hypothetical protein